MQEKGNFVAIASGRLQADAVDVAEELGIDSVISDGEWRDLPRKDSLP
ncbi:MAG: hypothetical protein ACLRZN_08915 [Dialister invisus]